MLLEFSFEALEEREGVRGRPGESRQHRPLGEPAKLLRAVLQDHLVEGDLAVGAEGHLAVLADADHGGGSDADIVHATIVTAQRLAC